MGWNAIGIARGFSGDDEQMDEMLEKAYRKGRKDMREEMEGGRYGERGGYSGSGRGGYACVNRGKKTMTTTMITANVAVSAERVRIPGTDAGRLWTGWILMSAFRKE